MLALLLGVWALWHGHLACAKINQDMGMMPMLRGLVRRGGLVENRVLEIRVATQDDFYPSCIYFGMDEDAFDPIADGICAEAAFKPLA